MKRTFIVTALAVLLSAIIASTASAASLSLNVVGGTNLIEGQDVTLELIADISELDRQFGLDVRVSAGGGIDWTGATQVPLTSFAGSVSWTTFSPICDGADPCVAINQANPNLAGGGFLPDPFNGVLSTITGVVGSPGDYVISVEAVGEGFFGAPAVAPVSITVVPEPTTAALLGLGLIGLGVAVRRR